MSSLDSVFYVSFRFEVQTGESVRRMAGVDRSSCTGEIPGRAAQQGGEARYAVIIFAPVSGIEPLRPGHEDGPSGLFFRAYHV